MRVIVASMIENLPIWENVNFTGFSPRKKVEVLQTKDKSMIWTALQRKQPSATVSDTEAISDT